MNNPRTHYLGNKQVKKHMASQQGAWKILGFQPPTIKGHASVESSEPVKVFNYVCTGKLTLVPAFIFFLGFGAGYLLFGGDKGPGQVYYGLAGAALSCAALTLFVFLVLWLVLRVSFTITRNHFRIVKSGILRSSLLEFDPSQTSLHYFQTHFSDERAWLQLVVRENDSYYTIFSWKGSGQQKNRFLRLFKTLKAELQQVQKDGRMNLGREPGYAKIISNEEFTLLSPFFSELQQLDQSYTDGNDASPLCIENIPVTSFDSFFEHFTHNKLLNDDSISQLYLN